MTTINKKDRLSSDSEYHIAKLDGSKTKTLKKFYKKIAPRLEFPDYFGNNLDGLVDMLSDLTWLEAPNVVIYIKNMEAFLSQENEENRNFVFEIFDEAVAGQIDEDRKFEVVKVV